MKKKSIINALLALVVYVPVFSQTPYALPLWERKSAPAVILGRYTDWQPGDNIHPSYWGNNKSLKETTFPECTIDSIGGFTLVWDICYPLKHEFHEFSIWLCPGDTIKVDINSRNLAEYTAYSRSLYGKPSSISINDTLQTLFKKAIHIEGGTLEQPVPIHLTGFDYSSKSESFVKAHLHDTFNEWREMGWGELQSITRQLDAMNLSPAQREYYRLVFEQAYISHLKGFMSSKTYYDFLFKNDQFKDYVAEHHLVRDSVCITDEAELEAFRQQFTQHDPHAAELTFYRSRSGFYVCQEMDYLQANSLEDSPLGQWLKEVEAAKAVMAQVKALQPVSENEITSLSQEFQVQIREVQAQLQQKAEDGKGVQRELPDGAPQEWLPEIVAEHKGHIVFVDFWATWCGPCLKGMKEMESVKDELKERGVDYIYITDTSSNTKEWMKHISQHAGDHYIVPKEKMGAMQIPDYDNAIPHYLIYDREGQFVKAFTGWSDVETMKNELTKIE